MYFEFVPSVHRLPPRRLLGDSEMMLKSRGRADSPWLMRAFLKSPDMPPWSRTEPVSDSTELRARQAGKR